MKKMYIGLMALAVLSLFLLSGCGLSGGDSGIRCRQNNEQRGCNDINKVCCYTFKEGMNYATHIITLKTDCVGEGTSIIDKDYCDCNC